MQQIHKEFKLLGLESLFKKVKGKKIKDLKN